jgi:hypothetical protein
VKGKLDMVVDSEARLLPLAGKHPGLLLLRDAWVGAQAVSCDVWQFALEGTALQAVDLTPTDLRLLLARGWVDHRREITRPSDPQRRFRRVPSLALSVADCFVLTEAGYRLVTNVAPVSSHDPVSSTLPFILSDKRHTQALTNGATSVPFADSTRPHWDAKHRELRLGAEVIKRFTHAAPSQELILSAFQEEGWPVEIDDPLPLKGYADAKRRLRQTVKNLNRAQRLQHLQFVINPDGESLRWQLTGPIGPRSRVWEAHPGRTSREP